MQLALTFIIRVCIIILNMHDKEKKKWNSLLHWLYYIWKISLEAYKSVTLGGRFVVPDMIVSWLFCMSLQDHQHMLSKSK